MYIPSKELIQTLLEGYNILMEAQYQAVKTTLAPHTYYSPRWKELSPEEVHVREVAYSIKNADSPYMKEAAKDMAKLVQPNSILVPLPTSKGDTSANKKLANEIAALSGSKVVDILSVTPRESNLVRAKTNQTRLGARQMGMFFTSPPSTNKIYFIDNVLASGATIQAARNTLGAGVGLVYAKVPDIS